MCLRKHPGDALMSRADGALSDNGRITVAKAVRGMHSKCKLFRSEGSIVTVSNTAFTTNGTRSDHCFHLCVHFPGI